MRSAVWTFATLSVPITAILVLLTVADEASSVTASPSIEGSAVAQQGPRILLPRPQLLPLGADQQLEVQSLLKVNGRMQYGEFLWQQQDVPPGPILARIDLANQMISIFQGGHEIGTAPILHGADHKPTPLGRFAILEKRAQHRSNLYDAEMPFMLRLTYDGIAIHAADVRVNAATNGCIGVPTGFAQAFFQVSSRGDPVMIIG